MIEEDVSINLGREGENERLHPLDQPVVRQADVVIAEGRTAALQAGVHSCGRR